jgi:hypothetical protein
MDPRPSVHQIAWGLLGAGAAAWFAIWMLFFPQFVPDYFAWDVHPRAAQVFIGAGYIFRTLFFLNVAREGNWFRLRWIVYGNLAFTGTLLFATYWHLAEFHWNPLETPLAHIWIILYIFEPVSMLYLIPRGIMRAAAPPTGGPVRPALRRFLVFCFGILLLNGLLIVANPEFAATRWPWELNALDSRIVGAWFLGWAVWSGTMAFAVDWDEIRRACQLFILCGAALLVATLVYRDEIFIPGRVTPSGYIGGLVVLTVVMSVMYLLQERARPASVTTSP